MNLFINHLQVHVCQSSTVADHCRTFALSDPDSTSFRGECDHLHNETCDRCAFLHSALAEVESALAAEMENLTDDEKEEFTFKVTQATDNILAWKAHILRSIHQDRARVELLDMLDETSVLLVQDWAMKYLPRKYRESQTDWFGKRGIPWHISVAFRKRDEQIELLTFCHIFKSCTQDSSAVLAVMANVIEQLKSTMPRMDTVFYRQDNAGCYHCGASIICASIIGHQQGVAIRRLDFSDAQGGKGACDRKAATIKVHMRAYLNSGHDIESAEQMYDAMTSSGGIPSLSVTLCDCVTAAQAGPYKIDGVSFLSNIAYTTEGIRVWRAYNIGPGKLIPGVEVNTAKLPALEVNKSHPSTFTVVTQRHTSTSTEGFQDNATNEVGAESTTSLFACPEEGCAKTFLRHSSLLRHLDCGKHQLVLERETLFDKAALEYQHQLEGHGGATLEPVLSAPISSTGTQYLTMGWALKAAASRRTRFTAAQRSYLTDKFRRGEETGRKADPASVARAMMTAKDAHGSRLFTSGDFLTANQVAGFFSRLASKKSLADDPDAVESATEEAEEDIGTATVEADFQEMMNVVVDDLLPKHPLIYDSHNLCELASKGKFTTFAVSVLREMCCSFGIDVEDIHVKRRKPYADRLQSFCDACTWKQ